MAAFQDEEVTPRAGLTYTGPWSTAYRPWTPTLPTVTTASQGKGPLGQGLVAVSSTTWDQTRGTEAFIEKRSENPWDA